MPPEYCEYGPDFETRCDPWLRSHNPELRAQLEERRQRYGGVAAAAAATGDDRGTGGGRAGDDVAEAAEDDKPPKPDRPWTTAERLTAFYQKYVPENVDKVPGLLEKYANKEEKLFEALTKKYGPEPVDPYFTDEDEDDEESDEDGAEQEEEEGGSGTKKSKQRRGVPATKKGGDEGGTGTGKLRVVVAKVSQKKRRHQTVVSGLDDVSPKLKLKDVSKAFSKRFAGSSSVKDDPHKPGRKDIIIQGDHLYDVAEMIVDKFGVPEQCVFLDIDGDVVPLR